MTIKTSNWADRLWGPLARSSHLLIAAALLLLMMLGSRELWTQEHRWADIVSGMFFRHDFLHPYLGTNDYYDKPLLSYWLIAAVSFVTNGLNTWAIRLPSALSGLLAVWSIYRLGYRLKNKQFGLLCGWLLLTTFYFVFWARVSSADMLNLGGCLFAVCWYFEKRDEISFFNYFIFFLAFALTSLCKGLAVVAVLAVLPDLIYQHRWKKHLNLSMLMALIPAMAVYVLPFWLSSHFGGNDYGQNGLYLVYRENVLRYFQPFDHKDPIYTYFLFLPIYLLPWTLFFIPALASLKSRWKMMDWNSKWMVWSLLALFVFFTASGSRRSYYVLPMLPFAILMTADWLIQQPKKALLAARLMLGFFLAFFIYFGLAQPFYYEQGGHHSFAEKLKAELNEQNPNKSWKDWNFVLLDPESKVAFYLQLPPEVKFLGAEGERRTQTAASMVKMWPLLKDKPQNVIFISRKYYATALAELLPTYQKVEAPATLSERFLHREDPNASIAFVPRV